MASWNLVNLGSVNGLVPSLPPSGTKPLPEPMLTYCPCDLVPFSQGHLYEIFKTSITQMCWKIDGVKSQSHLSGVNGLMIQGWWCLEPERPVFSRDHFGYGLNQWEKVLHSNTTSHWPSPHPEWSLILLIYNSGPILHPDWCLSIAGWSMNVSLMNTQIFMYSPWHFVCLLMKHAWC